MAPTKSAKGALGELRLAVEYMNKGYWVALSIDPQCPFDMVVVDKNGKCNLSIKGAHKKLIAYTPKINPDMTGHKTCGPK